MEEAYWVVEKNMMNSLPKKKKKEKKKGLLFLEKTTLFI
jgi:hypothetical protein